MIMTFPIERWGSNIICLLEFNEFKFHTVVSLIENRYHEQRLLINVQEFLSKQFGIQTQNVGNMKL